jgi:hypothetical protein
MLFQPPAAFLGVVVVVEVNIRVFAGDELLSVVVQQASDKPPRSSINSLSGHNLGPGKNPTQRLRTLTTAMPAGAASSLELGLGLDRAFPSLGPGETLGSALRTGQRQRHGIVPCLEAQLWQRREAQRGIWS